ncbi:MAG: hypothetical protein QOE23_1167 [Pseudonocardiales bacterium]|nr:hypothetical protein [Pseudonocardiales bacterium]
MELPSEPVLRLNIHTADPDTPTADGLKLLATWAATRSAETAEGSRPGGRSQHGPIVMAEGSAAGCRRTA